ncbi:hypothetical protein PLICRDRAFT_34958 [Plicaturopsis crispa FD-325 SS-3]|nr:hypothetical protein PLICRDRAFT_34958 [Plicaturopsis crispa FD-325 SS-3]
MSFTNINDPAGVKALLDTLRSSQAWSQVAGTSENDATPFSEMASNSDELKPVASTSTLTVHGEIVQPGSGAGLTSRVNPQPPAPSTSSSSVASLLSQLQTSHSLAYHPDGHRRDAPFPSYTPPQSLDDAHVPPTGASPESHRPATHRTLSELRSYTFQQALPRLSQLSENPDFVASLTQMKQEQGDVERQLWEERLAIRKKYDDKVDIAKKKASMIGAGLSKHEADMMSSAFRKELQKFDAERVLPAWDGLVSKQQTALENLGVPTMFNTGLDTDKERQHRVAQVLESIAGDV